MLNLLLYAHFMLQDVVSQNKKLRRYHEAPGQLQQRGLKSLSKANRDRLEAYQHLFYLLQTNPTYLARLIFAMPQSRTTKFMESAVLTLYNYASNQREEYLLLKLFKTALEEEIKLEKILNF
jgi:Ras GTPase-activating-like protein IQGAP1